MTTNEMVSQYQLVAGFLLLAALVWGLCGATALSRFWSHRAKKDLGWAAAFMLLALAQAIDGYVAYRMAGEFGVLSAGPASLLEFGAHYRLRTSAFVMVAALASLVLLSRGRPGKPSTAERS